MNPPATTQRVLYDVARRAGYIPKGDDVNLDPVKAQEILAYMDDRLQEAWRFTISSRRPCSSSVRSARTGIRTFATRRFCCLGPMLATVLSGVSPDGGAARWATRLSGKANPSLSPRDIRVYPLGGHQGKTPIGTCFGAWTKNPHEDASRMRVSTWFRNRVRVYCNQ
jgi:hypothetical protein